MKFRIRTRAGIALACTLTGGAGVAVLSAARSVRPGETSPVPVVMHDEGYVGSGACTACHQRNHDTWYASYHRTMTQAATAESVLAPFDGTTPVFEGTAWKLARDGARYFATPMSPQGEPLAAPMQVVLTTGSHHYQIYWMSLRAARELAQLPLVWHVDEQRWVPRKAMFLEPPTTTTHPETGRWSQTCIKCHTTNGTKSHPPDGATTVAQLGIACEACHGPGAEHVALERERAKSAADEPSGKSSSTSSDASAETAIVNPRALPHDRASQVCGQCHGIHPLAGAESRAAWERDGFSFRPGEDLDGAMHLLRGVLARNADDMRGFIDRHPETLPDSFWSDGEVRVSGREYNGLVESPCYQHGEMSCLSCHELHPSKDAAPNLRAWADDQLRAGMNGPRACLQCHEGFADSEKLAAHTHHAAGSPGSDCLNCHMPYTTYGLTKAIRSHTISSPSVATTLATGRPDACNQCHLDRSLGWAADRMHEWYGHDRPKLDGDQESVAASVSWALEGDAGQRALMAWSYGWPAARAASGTGWMPFVVSTLMQDEYDAVRWIAARTARMDPRWSKLRIEPTLPLQQQLDGVRSTILADWMRDGLYATESQRAAVLVRPDGRLDEERFRALYGKRDRHPVRLNE